MKFRLAIRANVSVLRQVSAVFLAVVFLFTSEGVSLALAQSAEGPEGREIILAQSGPFSGFNPFAPLQRLFGGGEKRKRKQPKQQKRKVSRPTGSAPKFTEVQKDPNAGLILVVGDRMARGVADGLKYTLADKPQIRVEQITEDKKGFAGAEPTDWTTQVLSKIRGADVKAIVVMVGRQDVGASFPGEPPVEYMTSEWLDIYQKRIDGFVRTVRQEKKPIVWAGLPPTNDDLINGDFTQLNSLFQGAAEDRRVRYVDIWDIFLAEDGSYSSFGPDVDGKNARLRTNNKIDFTWAGYRKVAFFVERELSRILGGYGGLAFEGVDDDPNFIVLTGRTTSPEALLLGGEDDAEMDQTSAAYKLFVEGQQLAPVSGRVDDPRMAVEGTSALFGASADGT
ncbi:MAG: GDSL-type esterase/lipase family protein [Roseibium sp.]